MVGEKMVNFEYLTFDPLTSTLIFQFYTVNSPLGFIFSRFEDNQIRTVKDGGINS